MIKKVKRFGRYLLLERIGIGGTSEIFKGLTFNEYNTPVFVAIKKVLSHLREDKEFIDMLLYEARLMSMLKHPNIIEVYEFTKIDRDYILVLEYIPGKDLKRIIEKCRKFNVRFSYENAAYIVAEALAGLDHAHRLVDSKGNFIHLVHRDFSPSNILIGYDGVVKICDFGIAKSTLSTITTKTGIVKGKVKYMSPEQAQGKKLDHRSDIYSAGIVLYELVTGRLPFTGENDIEIIHRVREGKYIPPRKLDPKIPEELEDIILKAMSRSRSARFSSAKQFREELLKFLEKRGSNLERQIELSLFMRRLWLEDLEKEYTRYDYIIVEEDEEETKTDYGENLLKDVLGDDAPYTNFKPFKDKKTIASMETKTISVSFCPTKTIDYVELADMETKIIDIEDKPVEEIVEIANQPTRIISIDDKEQFFKRLEMETQLLNIGDSKERGIEKVDISVRDTIVDDSEEDIEEIREEDIEEIIELQDDEKTITTEKQEIEPKTEEDHFEEVDTIETKSSDKKD